MERLLEQLPQDSIVIVVQTVNQYLFTFAPPVHARSVFMGSLDSYLTGRRMPT